MTLLQQQRLAKLRSQLDRNLDARDGTLDRLVRLHANIKMLIKAIDRAQKRMAAEPKSTAPQPIAPPAPPPAPVPVAVPVAVPATAAVPAPLPPGGDGLDVPDFLRRTPLSDAGKAILAEQEAKRLAKSRGRIEKLKAKQSGAMKRMPLEGKDALKAIFG